MSDNNIYNGCTFCKKNLKGKCPMELSGGCPVLIISPETTYTFPKDCLDFLQDKKNIKIIEDKLNIKMRNYVETLLLVPNKRMLFTVCQTLNIAMQTEIPMSALKVGRFKDRISIKLRKECNIDNSVAGKYFVWVGGMEECFNDLKWFYDLSKTVLDEELSVTTYSTKDLNIDKMLSTLKKTELFNIEENELFTLYHVPNTINISEVAFV